MCMFHGPAIPLAGYTARKSVTCTWNHTLQWQKLEKQISPKRRKAKETSVRTYHEVRRSKENQWSPSVWMHKGRAARNMSEGTTFIVPHLQEAKDLVRTMLSNGFTKSASVYAVCHRGHWKPQPGEGRGLERGGELGYCLGVGRSSTGIFTSLRYFHPPPPKVVIFE